MTKKTYTIEVDRVEHGFIEVEATDRAEAVQVATVKLESGDGFRSYDNNETIIKVINEITN